MDYTFVDNILRECHVVLRDKLNPPDILPYMSRWFTNNERDQVECKLHQNGPGQANDEILNIVRRKPNSFLTLVAAMKVTKNDVLYKQMCEYIEKIPGQIEYLQREVNQVMQLQQGPLVPTEVIYNRGSSAVGLQQSPYMLEPPQTSSLAIGPPQSPHMLQPPQPVGPPQSLQNQPATSERQRFLPEVTPATSLPSMELRVGETVSAPTSQPGSSCATPDQNNFEDMELSQVSGRITRRLGKELGKKSDDDYAHWTNVLDSLDIELSTEEEEKIEDSCTPGLKFLQLLGRKKIKVRQLSKALKDCGLDGLNNILFERTANPRQPQLHPSRSEGDHINQMQGMEATGSVEMNIEPFRSLPTDNFENRFRKQKSADKTMNIPQGSFETNQGSENTDDSSRNDSLESSESNLTSTSMSSPRQSPSNISGGNLPNFSESHLAPVTPSYYTSSTARESTERRGNYLIKITNDSSRNDSLESSESNLTSTSMSSHRQSPPNLSGGNLPNFSDSQLVSATPSYYASNIARESTERRGNYLIKITDDSSRNDSLESSESNLTSTSMSSHRQSPPNLSGGNLPNFSDSQLVSATPSYYASNIAGESTETGGSSLGPSSVGNPSLKDHRGIPPVQDPQSKKAALNPDTDCQKLIEDRVNQPDVLGSSLRSFGYENIHATMNSPAGDVRETGSGEPQSYTFDSVSRLQTPDLGLNRQGNAQAVAGDLQQFPLRNTQQQQVESLTSNTASETNVAGLSPEQSVETLSYELDAVNLNTDSLCQEDVENVHQ